MHVKNSVEGISEDVEGAPGPAATVTPGDLGLEFDASGFLRPSLAPAEFDYFASQPDYPIQVVRLAPDGEPLQNTGWRFIGSERLTMGPETVERMYFESMWTGEIVVQNAIELEGGGLFLPRHNAVSEDGGATWRLAEPAPLGVLGT